MTALSRYHRARVGAPVNGAGSVASLGNPSFDIYSGNRMAIVQNPVQEGMRVPLPLVPQGFANPIATATGGTWSGRPQGKFRPSRFICGSPQDTTGGFGVQVNQIFVGVDTCMAQQGPLSAANFQPNGVDLSQTYPTADGPIDCGASLTNVTGTTASLFANFVGEFLKGGGIALDG